MSHKKGEAGKLGENLDDLQLPGSRPNSGVSQAAWEGPDGEVISLKYF